MIPVLSRFQSRLKNNDIKISNNYLNDILKTYDFFYITEMFTDSQNQSTYHNFKTSNTIIINKYNKTIAKTKENYLIIGFKKTIIIIDQINLSFLDPLFSSKSTLNICFLSDIENIFSTNNNIKYTKINLDPNFNEEIHNFDDNFIICKTNDSSIINFFNSIKHNISGFLIKQSYIKTTKDRFNNINSNVEEKPLNTEYFDENEFIKLRMVGIGSIFVANLYYFINKEELVIIKTQNMQDNEVSKLQKRETENYLKINHFLLPKFYGLTKENNNSVIEFINGETLDKENDINTNDKLTIIFELIIIIEFLHRNHFIFRDLKPNNIVIDENKTAVLIDFDRMIYKNELSKNNIHSCDFNSPYVAPEVNFGNYDYGSDIYSLGKMIFYLITGKDPTYKNLSKINDFCKFNELKEMIKKCTYENIKDRPLINELIIEFYINYHSQMNFKKLFQKHENYFKNIFDEETINAMKNLEDNPNNPISMNYIGKMYQDGKYVQINADKAIHYYEVAANQNYAASQCNLGIIYYYGEIVKSDINKALHYLQLSAKQNYSNAEYLLGVIYYEGDNEIERNIKKSLEYFNSAAIHGSPEAQYQLGIIYYQGYFVTKDIDRSIKYFELAANQGIIQAQNNLGLIFYEGKYVSRDINKAIKYYAMAANKNNVKSQYNLGLIYSNDEFIKHDIEKAIYYYKLAADQSHVISQFNLAVIYDEGILVKRDIEKAIHYYKLAAAQFYSDAFYNLGIIYYENKYVKRDINKSIQYFKEAANLHDPQAQFKLGVIFYEGLYVVTDINKSIHYLKQASDQNYLKAHYNLGLIYYLGTNIKKDINKAIYYFIRGSEQNDLHSQYMLGCIYSDKSLDCFDITKAIYYLNQSANKNDCKAQYKLAVFYSNGKYLATDMNKALNYLQLAANQNNKFAQFDLGVYYLKRNIDKGVYYLQQSSENGFTQASFILGFLYHKGELVNQDIKKSIEYYKLASSFNNEFAKNNLGIIYKNGFENIIQKNIQYSMVYFKEAILQKNNMIAMYNLAHLYIYDDVLNNENINKSIDLLFKLLKYKFIPSLELLCIALLKKYDLDFDKVKEEVENIKDNEFSTFVIELIEKEKVYVKSNFDKLFDFYRNNVYYYDELIDYFPIRLLSSKSKSNMKSKNIDHNFYEGFGIN